MEAGVPIVLASDSNYLPFAYVTMYSILKTKKQRYYIKFYIMIPKGTEKIRYDKEWKFVDYSIQYIEVSEKYFQNIDMKIVHITKPTYYRLLIAEYLDTIDKCMYLDVDTFICNDLLDLYNLDLQGEYLAAGLGVSLSFSSERSNHLAGYLGIPTADKYVNVGVLVMNLKKIREDKLTQQFLTCSEKGWTCQDQDVLNICCYNRIKIFPLKYNLYSAAYNYRWDILEKRFSRSEIEDALKNPCIIHYATKTAKPWYNRKAVKGNQWWRTAEEALQKDLYEKIRERAREASKGITIPESIRRFELSESAILFGAGKAGRFLFDFLENREIGKVMGFFDNRLAGQNYKNVPIMAPALIRERDILIIITPQTGTDEMVTQLLELGYKEEQVVICGELDVTNFLTFEDEEGIQGVNIK